MVYLHPSDQLRLRHGAEHLQRLGARRTAEFLAEIGSRIGGMPAIFALLVEYEEQLSPRLPRVAGGNRFPPRPRREVRS